MMIRLRERGIALRILLAVALLAQMLPAQRDEAAFTCPMHPDVKSAKEGECPECGMALRVRKPATERSPAVRPAAPADGQPRFHDVAVRDQDGRTLRFYTDLVRGRTVAINFIFTTCTTICPPLTATFRNVQRTLGDRIGNDIALISVSVDPGVDTPERLKSFSEKFHAGPGWTFVTGSQDQVDLLLEGLGAAVTDKTAHTPMVVIGNDRARYWTRANGLAPAAKLAQIIGDTANRAK